MSGKRKENFIDTLDSRESLDGPSDNSVTVTIFGISTEGLPRV